MKKFCTYAVINVETGRALIIGRKWKEFYNTPIRYVESDTFYTTSFPCFWRKIKVTEYFRDVYIKGRHCVIVYWTVNRAKKSVTNGSCLTLPGFILNLRGQYYNPKNTGYPEIYGELLKVLGVS